MAVTPVAHPIDQCLHCKKPVFDDNIIVTKCHHVFDKACLEKWYKRQQTCPMDQAIISLLECQTLMNYLKPFSEYYKEDETFVISTLPKSLIDQVEKVCSICTEDEFAAVYYIPDSKSFMHQTCWINWIKLHPNETPPLTSWYPQQIATVERKWVESGKPSKLPAPPILPPVPSSAMAPPSSPRKPSKPIPPLALVVLAIAPVISLWAYMMNTRIYKNSNPLFFVLSIPVLITLKILSLTSFLFKRIFTERKA